MYGFVRTAYLLAFAYLGYSFLLNENLSKVRSQLNKPDLDIFPKESVFLLNDHDVPNASLGINIAQISEVQKVYFIIFDVQEKASNFNHRIGVMLPGPDLSDYNIFESITGQQNFKLSMNLEKFEINYMDKIHNPFIAHTIWKRKR